MGEFVARRGDTIQWRPHNLSDTLSLPVSGVTRLEVARGTQRPWQSGARIGALTGLALGVLVAAVTVENRTDCGALEPLCGTEKYWAMLEIGGVGTIVGGAAGLAMASRLRVDRWERVPLSPAPSR